MSATALETGDMMVVTVRLPTACADDLSVTAIGRQVRVIGPGGYRHEVTMADADLERLRAQLFHGILELRAPHTLEPPPPRVARAVTVEILT
jgi:HSP20 family molecular chaperone IbpA